MLQLERISKQYQTGGLIQKALDEVSLCLRDSEFVAILGPSGSGKTTLLNIIGGLDRYDTGDLIINGISTRQFYDREWDSYRNHTIGFVFQSYNLIPHQTILANVELSLTIAGVGAKERKDRAAKALEQVGLGDQIHKKPNQLSGGQMQRVAIARALVNDPDVLLADEPTGALDTDTGIQVMELLKEVAKDRLVVMVTHNPELAQQYADRIVRLRDGHITDDTAPYSPQPAERQPQPAENLSQPGALRKAPMGKASMSFRTALSLSGNNLRTKKGRTLLTSFAGSIGIIGIALIMALTNGVNTYIEDIQRETMTSYPITIQARTIDFSSFFEEMEQSGGHPAMEVGNQGEEGKITAGTGLMEQEQQFEAQVTENDLTAFKAYLDDPQSDIQSYLGENGVVYSYAVNFQVFSYDADGVLVDSNADLSEIKGESDADTMIQNREESMSMLFGGTTASDGAPHFSQIMEAADGSLVSPIVKDNYDLVYGQWPSEASQVVLVLDKRNTISAEALYQLGMLTGEQYKTLSKQVEEGETADAPSWTYEEALQHTFYLVPACDRYQKGENGTYAQVADRSQALKDLAGDGIPLEISGVIRPKEDADNANIITPVAYTSALTDEIIARTNASDVVQDQEADPSTNVLTGLPFQVADDAQRIENAKTFLTNLSDGEKASMYTWILFVSSEGAAESQGDGYPAGVMGGFGMSGSGESAMAQALDDWVANTPDDKILLDLYDRYLGEATYEGNLSDFGKTSYDAPSAIGIYTDSFEDKDAVAACIATYNEGVSDDQKIVYTDYVALITSSITTIINVISIVLMALVAVSLVVSCIMIGIITNISVLERTKEIGVLRALGASKRNISQVFNAETLIIGFCAGLLGVLVSMGISVPLTRLVQNLMESTDVTVSLPLQSAGILILISMAITAIGGLIPARGAARKDPVVALRTE